MPDGEYKWWIKEINRKLSLAKIAASHKGKEIIDDVLENDIQALVRCLLNIRGKLDES